MTKKVLFTYFLALFIGINIIAQRNQQRIGYVDLAYILENIPEYQQAQNQLDQKVVVWQGKLDKLKSEIETMKINLANERALLTDALIEERLEDIAIVEEELKKTEMAYFSSDGDLFFYRKLLVKPIQDQVYSAVQEIGKGRGFDIIFDKSSDIIMLYTNKKADISDLVLKSIVRAEKTKERNAKTKKKNSATPDVTRELTEEEKAALAEREAKRKAALDKAEQAKSDRAKKREAQKAEIEKKRLERLKKQEEARAKLRENKENKEQEKDSKEKDDNNS